MKAQFLFFTVLFITLLLMAFSGCSAKSAAAGDDSDGASDGDSDGDGDGDGAACDALSSCLGGDESCWECAKAETCKSESDACEADDQCAAYAPCAESCRLENTDSLDLVKCVVACKSEYPDGVALYEEMEHCLACEACPNACDELHIGVCLVKEEDTEPEEIDTERQQREELIEKYSQAPEDPPEGWLYSEGNALRLSDGDGDLSNDADVHLHGVSLIDVSRVFESNYEAQVDEAAAWGSNIIRLPVYPENEPQNDQPSDGSWSLANADNLFEKYLKPVVDYVTETKGMYAIVDWHYIQDVPVGSDYDNMTKSFWADMAPRLADNPRVLYEVFNEPINVGENLDANWQDWRPMAQEYVDIIREHAPHNMVLVGGPTWSQVIGLCGSLPIYSYNIMYVGHIYSYHMSEGFGGGILNQFALCAESFPVILTEWGVGGRTGVDEESAAAITDAIRDNNLHFTAWAFHDRWGPAMLTNMTSYDRNAYGEYVYNFMGEY